jgi:hypothetical protein
MKNYDIHFKDCGHVQETTLTHLEAFYADKWYCQQCDADIEVAEITEIDA